MYIEKSDLLQKDKLDYRIKQLATIAGVKLQKVREGSTPMPCTLGSAPCAPESGETQQIAEPVLRVREQPVGHRRDVVTFTPLQLRSCPTSSSSSGHPCRSGAGLALGALLRRGAASLHLSGGRLRRETQQNLMEIDSDGVRARASVQRRHPSP